MEKLSSIIFHIKQANNFSEIAKAVLNDIN